MRSALSAYRFLSLFFLSCSTCKSLPSWFVCQSHFLSNPDHAYTDISHDHAWNETSSYNQNRSFHSNRLDRINFSYVNVRIFACALLSLSDSCTFYSVCDGAITDAYILIRAAIFARWKSFDLCVCHTIFPSFVKVQQFNLNPNRTQSHFNQTLPLDNDL